MDERLAALADAQGGYFTRGDVLDCGYDDRHIREAVRAGEWARVRTGMYAPADVYDALDTAGKHLVAARSVVDKLGPAVAMSHSSACADRGLPQFDVDFSEVHVTRLDGGAGRREAGVVHHEGKVIRPNDVEERNGRLVLVPRRYVWEASTLTTQRGALVVMDAALHFGAIDEDQLWASASAYASWPGSRSASIAARLASGDAESPGESLTRYLCYEQHLPRPTLQHLVYDERGVLIARTDLAWLEYAHVAEFDGRMKYGRSLREGDSVNDAVFREKRREDLVRRQRLGVSRPIWGDVLPSQARPTAVWLRRDLEQSRTLYLHNRTVFAV